MSKTLFKEVKKTSFFAFVSLPQKFKSKCAFVPVSDYKSHLWFSLTISATTLATPTVWQPFKHFSAFFTKITFNCQKTVQSQNDGLFRARNNSQQSWQASFIFHSYLKKRREGSATTDPTASIPQPRMEEKWVSEWVCECVCEWVSAWVSECMDKFNSVLIHKSPGAKDRLLFSVIWRYEVKTSG